MKGKDPVVTVAEYVDALLVGINTLMDELTDEEVLSNEARGRIVEAYQKKLREVGR